MHESLPKTLKVLQLNVWMGKVEGELSRFLESSGADLICMQEVMSSDDAERHLSRLCFSRKQIQVASGLEHAFYSPNWRGRIGDGHMEFGNLILSRFPFVTTHSEFVHGRFVDDMVLGKGRKYNNVNVQIVTLANGLTVVNHHGFWYPSPVGNEESVTAFKKLAKIVEPLAKQPLVLSGDLNIIHESPAFLPLDFLRDLTFEAGVKNTLSGLKFNGKVACDHILVNDLVEARDFQVIEPCYASDHLPLVAEISLKQGLVINNYVWINNDRSDY